MTFTTKFIAVLAVLGGGSIPYQHYISKQACMEGGECHPGGKPRGRSR